MNVCKRLPRRILKGIIHIATDPGILNRVAPISYVFALVGIAGWGVCRAIPYLYSEYDAWISTAVQIVGCFIAIELFINWVGLAFVDSSYDPGKYGAPPVLFDRGTHVQQSEESYNLNLSRQRKDAVSVMDNSSNFDMTKTPYGIDKSVMAYFTWSQCIPCNRPNPPRAHHCILCKKCILKRDHHCYVAATCVGYRNLRYFSTFLFYAVTATIFASVHALPYAYYKVIPNVQFYDLFYPVTILRGIFGFVNYVDALLIILGWMLLIYLIFSSYSLFQVYKWITTGNTSFELINNIDIYDSRDLSGRIRAVFGRYWLLNFLFPAHFLFEPIDDPIRWQTFKRRGLGGAYFLS
ncbi:probable palmitoyltransferase ZDHHC24 [Mercenaria mercenaria]|uniref:probable palmitoyltransferase ZDHHC24 n=1 Tax=Mercenaria mercenaria TaxID=6596 RepID=UPI00234F3B97|nr:probable palmitoyltransferase ZDHHC24 [Mercenaria mercenaria]